MKILQLTKKFPYPLKDGESIAVTNLSKSLVRLGCEMTLLSMNTSKHFVDVEDLPETYNHYKAIQTVYLDNRVSILGALKNLFSKDSYHVSRFDFFDFHQRLIELLKTEEFDVIQLETLYLAPYIETIKSHSSAKIIMRSHNVEFEIWNRVVDSTVSLPKKTYLKYLTKKLYRFEVAKLAQYDALVTVTQRDLERYIELGYKNKGISSPIGVDVKRYQPRTNDHLQPSLSFIGSLDWIPNLDGLEWYLQSVFPEIINQNPELKLHIAGRNTPQSIRALANDNILIHGEVDSAIDFINDHSIMVVPLLSGSGMRVKILEGMALAKVVISTSIGAEGIDAEHKKSILIADTPKAFLECIKWLFDKPNRINEVGQNARKYINKHFDEGTNAAKLLDFYKTLL